MTQRPTVDLMTNIVAKAQKGRITKKALLKTLNKACGLELNPTKTATKEIPCMPEALRSNHIREVRGGGKKREWIFFEIPDRKTATGKTPERKTAKKIPSSPPRPATTTGSVAEEILLSLKTVQNGLGDMRGGLDKVGEALDVIAVKCGDLQTAAAMVETARREFDERFAKLETRLRNELDGVRQELNEELQTLEAQVTGDLERRSEILERAGKTARAIAAKRQRAVVLHDDKANVQTSGPICTKCRIRMSTAER